MTIRTFVGPLLAFAVACTGKSSGPSDSAAAGPCAAGDWGSIDEESVAGAIHMRADGSDDGDGTEDAALATLEVALELSRSGGARAIALGPGAWTGNLDLAGVTVAGADDGLVVAGCGPDETSIESADPEAPVVRVVGVEGFELAGLSLVGGYRGVVVWSGSSAALSELSVRDSERVGIVWDGSETFGSMVDVEVHDPQPVTTDDGEIMAYGIAIQEAAVTMTGGGVWGATRVGVLVAGFPGEDRETTLTDVTVGDTQADADGYWGRGIQIQDHAIASVAGGLLTGNRDAGLFALRAGTLDVQGLTVENTAASRISGGTAEPGDGIVIAQADGVSYADPVYFVTLSKNQVSGSERVGILVDGSGISATASGNAISASGEDPSGANQILVQGGAEVTGTDGVFDLDPGATFEYQGELLASDVVTE